MGIYSHNYLWQSTLGFQVWNMYQHLPKNTPNVGKHTIHGQLI